MSASEDIRGQTIALATAVDYSSGAIVSKMLMDKKTGSLTLFAFDAGQGLSEHTSPYDATVLILDGEAALTIGGKPVRPRTGEMVIMPAGIPHDVRANQGRFKMLLVMIR